MSATYASTPLTSALSRLPVDVETTTESDARLISMVNTMSLTLVKLIVLSTRPSRSVVRASQVFIAEPDENAVSTPAVLVNLT
jgi:hypothetical protein